MLGANGGRSLRSLDPPDMKECTTVERSNLAFDFVSLEPTEGCTTVERSHGTKAKSFMSVRPS